MLHQSASHLLGASLPCPLDRGPELTFAEPSRSAFSTIDPAPASTSSPFASSLDVTKSTLSVPELQANLNNTSLSLFERYRAMFALRNDGRKEAVLALASGFGDESALFRYAPSLLSLELS